MHISSRFTLAIHILVAIHIFKDEKKVTSELMSSSTSANPVTIRKIMKQLKDANIVEVKRGTGGMTLTRPMEEITLYDIFYAVDSLDDGKLFHFHENPNQMCPVGKNIHVGLDDMLFSIQAAMEDKLKSYTLADVVKNVQANLDK